MAGDRGGGPSKGAKPTRGAADEKVAVTIRISRDTFELLQNVALGHEISKIASVSQGKRVTPRDRTQSVAAVIEALIDRHRDSLEADDRLKPRGGQGVGKGGGKPA